MENKKIALLFYSVSGQTRFAAQKMRDMLNCDIFEIQTEKLIKADVFSRYYHGIKQMKSRELPKLKKMNFNPDMYDCIILGSPTWGSDCTPAIKAFAKNNKIENKKMCLFATCAASGDKECIESMKKLFPNNDFISTASFTNPKKSDKLKLKKKLKDFTGKILGD